MSGWYPDPMGRFEYRYHNGQAWTADVSTGGQRYVDPLSPTGPAVSQHGPSGGGPLAPPVRRAGNGLALAGMILGIVSLVIGWVPFIGIAGLVCAVIGLGLSIPGLARARRTGERRAFALTGVITSAIGIVLGALGIVLSVVVWRAVDRYENPGPFTEEVSCTVDDGGFVVATGRVTNESDRTRGYTVLVRLTPEERHRVAVDDVAPGQAGSFTVRSDAGGHTSAEAGSCAVIQVDGPVPFGLQPDLFD